MASAWWLVGGLGRPVLWVLPPGFQGWIQINYDDPTCPELQREGVFVEIPVPESGHVCTSQSSVFTVWRYHRYVYENLDGTHEVLNSNTWRDDLMVWGLSETRIFIGSEMAFQQEPGTP